MRYVNRFFILASAAGLLSACSSSNGVSDTGKQIDPGAASRTTGTNNGIDDFPSKIGEPYKIGGKTYTPADIADYDEVGYASFYGSELAGKSTANGEIFNPAGVSAAHKTLPMPSYVEVTSLETGKTILVRVNDRGPFVNDRLLDLSEAAARQLGMTADGVAGVRVRKVSPPEQERAVLREGRQAIERIETPDSLLVVLREKLAKLKKPAAPVSRPRAVAAAPGAAPASTGTSSGRFVREGTVQKATPPAPAQVSSGRFVREGTAAASKTATTTAAAIPRATKSGYIVQLGSFSSRSRADALAKKLSANVEPSPNGNLFRVRYGPYATAADAERGLATARQRGYPNARLFRQ